jgi:hypothetical protein
MERTPGTTAGMPVGAQVAQTQPTPVVTAWRRTKVLRRVDYTGAPVEREYRSGGHCRRGFGLYRVSLTQGTVGLLRQAREGFGRIGTLAS